MMRGPKVTMVLERSTATPDGGGGLIKAWTKTRKVKGVLTAIKGVEYVKTDKETVYATHQLWCTNQVGLDIAEDDEFSRPDIADRYRVVFVDNIIEKNWMYKIDLIRIK